MKLLMSYAFQFNHKFKIVYSVPAFTQVPRHLDLRLSHKHTSLTVNYIRLFPRTYHGWSWGKFIFWKSGTKWKKAMKGKNKKKYVHASTWDFVRTLHLGLVNFIISISGSFSLRTTRKQKLFVYFLSYLFVIFHSFNFKIELKFLSLSHIAISVTKVKLINALACALVVLIRFV